MLAPQTLPPPSSFLELEEHFGKPFTDKGFEDEHIVRIPATIAGSKLVHIACHQAIAPRLSRIFAEIKAQGLCELVKTYDGCFVIRTVRGNSRPSLHSWGLAIDINAGEFPLASKSHQDPRLVRLFVAEQFFNGANFKRPDPMHFQFTAGAL